MHVGKRKTAWERIASIRGKGELHEPIPCDRHCNPYSMGAGMKQVAHSVSLKQASNSRSESKRVTPAQGYLKLSKRPNTLQNFRNALPLDLALLPVRSRNPPVGVAKLGTLHVAQEILVVCDDDQLKVVLRSAVLDDAVEALGQ